MKRKYNNQKVVKWKRLLGEQTYNYCEQNNEKFRQYLSDHLEIEEDIEKGLEPILLVEMNYRVDEFFEEDDICFEQFYERIINYAVSKLTEALKGTEKHWRQIIEVDFANHVIKQLQEICIRTLIVKMNEYKQSKKLKGSNSKEEYNFFCNEIVGERWFIKELLLEYPVLYHCIKEKVHNMVLFYREVIEHFIKDKHDIEQYLCNDKKVEKIKKIHGNFSDVHNRGKQVLRIELDNEIDLFYKPRSMNNENMYTNMLQWISERIDIQQMSYPFLSCGNHSWTTIVEYQECEDDNQLKNYYLRMGVQLFLVYLLGTKDLHYENIIAAGEYPVLIDLETLVNICYNTDRESVNDEILYQLAQSVLYTGLLPYRAWNNGEIGIDYSAIAGGQSGKYPFKIPVIVNPKTSDMAVRYEYPQISNKKNLATIKGDFQNPNKYKEEIIRGFSEAYREVMKHREEFSVFFEEISCLKSRFLVRDTQYYSMLLSSSYHPSLLMNSIEREIFLNVLYKSNKDERIVNREISSLLRSDIPYFFHKLDGTALYDIDGLVCENYFEENSLQILNNKLFGLCKSDLEKQCEYIEISLGLSVGNEENYINRIYPFDKFQKENNRIVELEKMKDELIERLLNQVVWNREHSEVNWSVLQFTSSDTNSWRIFPMGYYLYEGLAGMLLLFHILSQSTEDARVARIRQTIQKMLFRYTDRANISVDNLQTNKTGIYEGESSIVYVYLLLYKLSGDRIYLEYAKKHIQIVEKLINFDKQYDLISGNTGAVLMFIKMFEITGNSKYISLAENALKIIDINAIKMRKGIGWCSESNPIPMAGMAHGNAGIIMAILSLYRITRREKYKALAIQALEYENSLYDHEINNWSDMRYVKQKEDTIGSIAWCHGAAGILLSRIAVSDIEDKDIKTLIEKDIYRAYEKLQEYYMRDSWCLCHGNCGNKWIIEEIDKWKKGGCKRKKYVENYDIKLLHQEKINPGLMSGYGGILYYLLKETGNQVYNILRLEL